MFNIKYNAPYNTEFFNKLYQFAMEYINLPIRSVVQPSFVVMFVVLSGISCSFSHNNSWRALKMMLIALAMTLTTYFVSMIIKSYVVVWFNVIHVIALSLFVWVIMEWILGKCTKTWQRNLFGIITAAIILTSLIVGYCFNAKPSESTNHLWYFLIRHSESTDFHAYHGKDYLPFLPSLGWFLLSVWLGKWLYREKRTLIPSVNPKWLSPVIFCGRHTLWLYFGTQIVVYGGLFLLRNII